jgi:hypothetical protein
MVWFVRLKDRVVVFQPNPFENGKIKDLIRAAYPDQKLDVRPILPPRIVFSCDSPTVEGIWMGFS